MRISWTFLVCLLFSSTVNANVWVYGNVAAVEDYGSYGNGEYQVLLSLTEKYWSANTVDASNVCYERFSLNTSYQGVTPEIQNRIYSMMLAALMSGKRVGLYVDVAGPYCKVQIGRIEK